MNKELNQWIAEEAEQLEGEESNSPLFRGKAQRIVSRCVETCPFRGRDRTGMEWTGEDWIGLEWRGKAQLTGPTGGLGPVLTGIGSGEDRIGLKRTAPKPTSRFKLLLFFACNNRQLSSTLSPVLFVVSGADFAAKKIVCRSNLGGRFPLPESRMGTNPSWRSSGLRRAINIRMSS
jgi:hypothetical protein